MLQTQIISMLLLLLTSCTQRGEDSIYILPKNFRGSVIVVYNQKKGIDKKYNGHKRVYEIPSTGVLKTKFSPDYGRVEFPEFYFENISRENQVPVVINWVNFSNDKLNATLPSTGKAYENLDGRKEIEYSTLFIGTKTEIAKYSKQMDEVDIINLIK